jgi:hypothetical protein
MSHSTETTQITTKPSWFFGFMAVYATLQMLWFCVLAWDFITHPFAPDIQFKSVGLRLFTGAVVTPLAIIVSVPVLRRAPGNITGLCLILWLASIMGSILRADSSLVIYDTAFNTGWSGVFLLGLFFPDGRSAFPRAERWITGLAVVFVVSLVSGAWLKPTLLINTAHAQPIPNPLYLSALQPIQPLVDSVVGLGDVAFVIIILLIIPSFIVRYRRGDVRTRLQIRWLAWILSIIILTAIPLTISGLNAIGGDPWQYGLAGFLLIITWSTVLIFFPYVAVGVAILRHRLYDIDIIIRRTLVYSILTALLALLYFGVVIGLQTILVGITGQAQSQLVTVITTLTIAALFFPLRRRVQNLIDRGFYRRKYDAAKTLVAFAATARDETDLDQLTARLGAVVAETMQPEDVRVWLKSTTPDGAGTNARESKIAREQLILNDVSST